MSIGLGEGVNGGLAPNHNIFNKKAKLFKRFEYVQFLNFLKPSIVISFRVSCGFRGFYPDEYRLPDGE